ncbi:transposase [Ureibacillus thermophilus]|uniref:transposase n=1 Tax=Ureibacillus thermophilus TaxID=367743 RepID=UPI00360F63B5
MRIIIFISFDPRQHIHKLIQAFKRRSSRILRENCTSLKSRLPSLWTRSYFCCRDFLIQLRMERGYRLYQCINHYISPISCYT